MVSKNINLIFFTANVALAFFEKVCSYSESN